MKQSIWTAVSILGGLCVFFGLLFFLQGMGWFPYPRSSFMINEHVWVIKGAVLFFAGIILLYLSRQFSRRPRR